MLVLVILVRYAFILIDRLKYRSYIRDRDKLEVNTDISEHIPNSVNLQVQRIRLM